MSMKDKIIPQVVDWVEEFLPEHNIGDGIVFENNKGNPIWEKETIIELQLLDRDSTVYHSTEIVVTNDEGLVLKDKVSVDEIYFFIYSRETEELEDYEEVSWIENIFSMTEEESFLVEEEVKWIISEMEEHMTDNLARVKIITWE